MERLLPTPNLRSLRFFLSALFLIPSVTDLALVRPIVGGVNGRLERLEVGGVESNPAEESDGRGGKRGRSGMDDSRGRVVGRAVNPFLV